jgi:hypothetical protein
MVLSGQAKDKTLRLWDAATGKASPIVNGLASKWSKSQFWKHIASAWFSNWGGGGIRTQKTKFEILLWSSYSFSCVRISLVVL